MARYVYRNGQMVNRDTGEPMLSDAERRRAPATPMVMGFTAYECPVTGKEIRTLGQHKDNLLRHNCVEAAEMESATKGEIRNARFAKKHGLEVADRYKDEPWKPETRKEQE